LGGSPPFGCPRGLCGVVSPPVFVWWVMGGVGGSVSRGGIPSSPTLFLYPPLCARLVLHPPPGLRGASGGGADGTRGRPFGPSPGWCSIFLASPVSPTFPRGRGGRRVRLDKIELPLCWFSPSPPSVVPPWAGIIGVLPGGGRGWGGGGWAGPLPPVEWDIGLAPRYNISPLPTKPPHLGGVSFAIPYQPGPKIKTRSKLHKTKCFLLFCFGWLRR
jgi:hypothetical protein